MCFSIGKRLSRCRRSCPSEPPGLRPIDKYFNLYDKGYVQGYDQDYTQDYFLEMSTHTLYAVKLKRDI
jgi:hypothetical protein